VGYLDGGIGALELTDEVAHRENDLTIWVRRRTNILLE